MRQLFDERIVCCDLKVDSLQLLTVSLIACLMSTTLTDFHRQPYAFWEATRSPNGLAWSRDFFGGAWLVSRHALAEQVLRDTEHFSAARTGAWVGSASHADSPSSGGQRSRQEFQALFARAMLFVDGQSHRRLRQLMQDFFKSSALAAWQPEIEAQIVRRCAEMEAQAAQGLPVDWIAALARPLPAEVIVRFLGLRAVSDEEFAQFGRWSYDLAAFIGAPVADAATWRAALRSLMQLAGFFRRAMRAGRFAAGGLLAHLQQALVQDDGMHDLEFVAQAGMLLFAGHETTRHILGSALWHLLQQPSAWQQLCAQPELASAAVNELLRLEPPVQYTARRVRLETTLEGQTLRRNDLVIVGIAQALRDPERFSDAEALRIERSDSSNLAFGTGPHICIGAGLTQLEAKLVLQHISQRWPGLKLAADTAQQPAAIWDTGSMAYRGLAHLYVQLPVPAQG